jgi:hypothetical protein
MAKIDGQTLYEFVREAAEELGDSGIIDPDYGWHRQEEDLQQSFKLAAKKINDYLIYGRKPSKD